MFKFTEVKMLNSFKFLAVLLMIFSFISCSSSKSVNDSDAVPDADSDGIGIVEEDTDSEEDSDFIDDSDGKPDADADQDTDSDIPETVECLDLRYNENTIKTPFPFKDANGKPTFCRPGCDTPTENDPQCVRNIWEWDNWSEYQVYLKAEKENPGQYPERECYPWPCKIPDTDTSIESGLRSICDRNITVHRFYADSGTVWTHGMSDGVAGMALFHSGRIVEYDPQKDEFMILGKKSAPFFFNHGRYIVSVFDSYPVDNLNYKSYVISVLKKGDEYFYEFVYDNENHNAFFSRPPFVGKDWALIQVCEGKGGKCDVKYAKADNWEWHSLNIGKVQEGNIVDDRLSFIIHDGIAERQIYYCDLSKYPSSIKECTKVTRKLDSGYELGHSPRIDENDKNRLVFYSYTLPGGVLVEVKFEDGKEPAYKEIVVGTLASPQKIEGNLIMATSVLPLPVEEANGNLTACFYRFDKNKLYCPVKHDWPTQDMAFPTFSGKWQLYKGEVSFTIRDWECYCKENNVCPFEE